MNNIKQSLEIMACTKNANSNMIADVLDKELFGKSIEDAIESMIKQIKAYPLEIKERRDFRGDVYLKDGYCPKCKNGMSNSYLYCNHCGQAIDWSVKND